MISCTACNEEIGFFRSLKKNLCHLCETLKENNIPFNFRDAVNELDNFLGKNGIQKKGGINYQDLIFKIEKTIYLNKKTSGPLKIPIVFEFYSVHHKKDKEDIYPTHFDELCKRIIEDKFNISKTLSEIQDKLEYKLHMESIKRQERKRKIKDKAERDFYGRIKRERETIPKEERSRILRRFNNKCALCNIEENLHIHHKDKNPKNNIPENLIVLCSTCHKRAHAKV